MMQNHCQDIKSNWFLIHAKVIVLMCLMGWLLPGFGNILIIMHIWITVGCICSHILFNNSIYPSSDSPQRPIVASNNLVENDFDCSKEGEKSMKQDSKYLQLRWYPLDLSHTQKRRLQRMRKKESMEQQAEAVPMKSATTKKVWWPKQVISPSTWVTTSYGRRKLFFGMQALPKHRGHMFMTKIESRQIKKDQRSDQCTHAV